MSPVTRFGAVDEKATKRPSRLMVASAARSVVPGPALGTATGSVGLLSPRSTAPGPAPVAIVRIGAPLDETTRSVPAASVTISASTPPDRKVTASAVGTPPIANDVCTVCAVRSSSVSVPLAEATQTPSPPSASAIG